MAWRVAGYDGPDGWVNAEEQGWDGDFSRLADSDRVVVQIDGAVSSTGTEYINLWAPDVGWDEESLDAAVDDAADHYGGDAA